MDKTDQRNGSEEEEERNEEEVHRKEEEEDEEEERTGRDKAEKSRGRRGDATQRRGQERRR